MYIFLIWLICLIVSYPLFRLLGLRDFGKPDGRSKIFFLFLSIFGPASLVAIFFNFFIGSKRDQERIVFK